MMHSIYISAASLYTTSREHVHQSNADNEQMPMNSQLAPSGVRTATLYSQTWKPRCSAVAVPLAIQIVRAVPNGALRNFSARTDYRFKRPL